MHPLLTRPRAFARFLYHQRIKGFAVPAETDFGDIATQAFGERLARSRSYLEFGSGASTLLAGRLGVPTVAVESDRFFARSVRAALPPGAPVRFADVDIGVTIEWGKPLHSRPTPARVRRWSSYVTAPYALLDGFPDFILVDGRFRLACALEAVRRARAGGHAATMMFDDYIDRPQYHGIEAHIGAPRMMGRAAFFELDPARPAVAVSPAIVTAALSDWS